MFENIPVELRQHHAWVVWRYATLDNGKVTKHPHNARTGHMASVSNPDDWSTYDAAVAAAPNYSGIGFVLSDNDPYTVIDLDHTDDPGVNAFHEQIKSTFNTYQEISPSGKGVHIWVRGTVAKGSRKGGVEIYPNERYMTVTGDTSGPTLEITDCQAQLISLYTYIGGTIAAPVFKDYGNEPQRIDDGPLCDMAVNAANGAKFLDLYKGDWEQYYTSQSEADFALVNIIAFFSDNREQVTRIFRASALGQRDKAQRDDYMNGMVGRSFDRKKPRADIEALKAAVNKMVDAKKTPSTINPYLQQLPGLTGELAKFIYNSAPHPVPEIAVAGALGLMAGITGRAWNISATGLNQYLLLLSGTGTGKEAMASGINKLITSVTQPGANGIGAMPSAAQFLGPAEVASGQAIIKYMSKRSKSFVSIFGEFDNLLRDLTDPRASASTRKLRQFFLSVYNKSGTTDVMGDMIYADTEKNVDPIMSPAFSMLGECTPDRLYGLLDGDMITDGFLPRFTIIEYDGDRTPRNEGAGAVMPSPDLVTKLATLCAHAQRLNQQNLAHNVGETIEAREMFRSYERLATSNINGPDASPVAKELWTRAAIKAMKLAATLAVGVNPIGPIITPVEAKWAIDSVTHSTKLLENRFERGDVGHGEAKQFSDMRKAFLWANKNRQGGVTSAMWKDKVVPVSVIINRVNSNAAFRHDRMGPTIAIKRCISALVEQDRIRELGSQQVKTYNTRAKLYVVSDAAWLMSVVN